LSCVAGAAIAELQGRPAQCISEGDKGMWAPTSDARDLASGAQFIPNIVTLLRGQGKQINFVQECSPNCWYWEMRGGMRVYHYDPFVHDEIARQNGKIFVETTKGPQLRGEAGSCPKCGNPFTRGLLVRKGEVARGKYGKG
jgi:hypothetical protein